MFAPECYRAEPVEALRQDVIFVGSYGYHKEWPYRQQLLNWLAATYGSRFTHYDHASHMRGHRLNQLYASAKIVVGDSCCLGFTGRDYWSDRVPETLGRGGVLIHPWIKGLDDDYQDSVHLRLYAYGDFAGLKDRIDELLHDADRERIRLAGHAHVKAHHTYTHRVQQMLDIIQREAQ